MVNLKLRLQNKATLTALIATGIGFIYEILGLLGIVPCIGQDAATQIGAIVITALAAMGIVVDPTTTGISDNVEQLLAKEPATDDVQVLDLGEETEE